MAAQISAPWLVLAKMRNGKCWVFVEIEPGASVSLQWRQLLLRRIVSLDVLDSEGRFFTSAKVTPRSIDWDTYREFGLFGLVVFIVSAISLSVLINCEVDLSDYCHVDVRAIKARLVQIIERRECVSTIPDDELVRIVSNAKSIPSLIKSILRSE